MYLMNIHKETLIANIQNEFNSRYSFLWIDFYHTANPQSFSKAKKVGPETSIKEISRLYCTKAIDISGKREVSEVLSDVKNILGLEAHILRKCGNVWVGTTLTEHWTLERQNLEGALIEINGE